MIDLSFQLAFIGPGGPEFIVIMLVLLMMFGAKDAPRILRKLNEMLNQIRNTADGFKREVMYSDLKDESPSFESPHHFDGPDHDEDEPIDDAPDSDAEDEDGDAQKV